MDNKYRGMTVNERLFVSGFLDEFDFAVKERDINKATEILKKVELTDNNISPILKHYGLI